MKVALDVEGALRRAREEDDRGRLDVGSASRASPIRRVGPAGAGSSSLVRGSRRRTRPQLVHFHVSGDAVTVRQGPEKGTEKVGEHRNGALIHVRAETIGSRDSNGLLVVETVTPPLGAIRGGWVRVNSSTGRELLTRVTKLVRPGKYAVRCRRITREGASKHSALREPLAKGDVVCIVDSQLIEEHSAVNGVSYTVRVKCADGRWFTVDRANIIELLEDYSTRERWEEDDLKGIGLVESTVDEEAAPTGPQSSPPPYTPTLFSEAIGLNGSFGADSTPVSAGRILDDVKHVEKPNDHSDHGIIAVTCPSDVTHGDLLCVTSPGGRELVAQIPVGISAGMDFNVDTNTALTVEEWKAREQHAARFRKQYAAGFSTVPRTPTARQHAFAAATAVVSSRQPGGADMDTTDRHTPRPDDLMEDATEMNSASERDSGNRL
eukprot:COSAG02_NODE_10282_length_1978_cov_3.766897_1_plen_435_part_10